VLFRSLPNPIASLLAYTHQAVSFAAPRKQANRVPGLGILKRNRDLRPTA
jgi:hypothetical protein